MEKKNNPIIWADIPDVDVIRVEDTYYMISTTMHLMPGGAIFRSYDLINWEIVTYLYDVLEDSPGARLEDGQGIYAAGMWAATLRYHKGKFYVIFVTNDTRSQNVSFLFTSDKIEGPWEKRKIEGFYYDCSLYFEGDRPFILSGNGRLRLVEMKPDLSAPLPGGIDKVIITDTDYVWLRHEGSHMYKINGKYYIFTIHWLLYGSRRRVEACFFSDNIDGPYVGNNILDDDMGYHNAGVAQGGIVDTPDGDWYAMLFQDHGAVGRIPVLVPMMWDKGWPVFGIDGKVPHYVETKSTRPNYKYTPIVESDDFDYADGERLKLAWQWNHIPDNNLWSTTERKGWLRLKTGMTVPNVTLAKNSLGQRTMGPACEAEVKIDVSSIKDGDYAGLCLMQQNYGFIAVTKEAGEKYIVMLGRGDPETDADGKPVNEHAVPGREYGDGMPDITLLPRIASFYDTTVDFLLGCDSIRKQEDMAVFKEKAQALINQGKRRERLELCRAYQKKYPNDESVMFELMHDLFSLDSIGNGDEIISIANRLLNSNNTEYHFGAVQMLAFTSSKLGNYDTAVKYARSIPANRDILRSVLKDEELVEHCKWYFWRVCDDMYATENRLTQCAEASYTAEDRHKIRKAIYDIFNVIFSDGDFGFWEERLARICRDMARSSAESGKNDRAISELEEMCKHLEKFKDFKSIDHTSTLVKGLHYDISQSGKSSEESLAKAILRDLNENSRFKCMEDDDRFISIKSKLEALG